MYRFPGTVRISLCVLLVGVSTVVLVVYKDPTTITSLVTENSSAILERMQHSAPPWEQDLNFTGFDNDAGTEDGHYIVPNYVHFIKFNQTRFSFPQTVCILASLKHQRPEKLFLHTDAANFSGKYWDVLVNTPGFMDVLVLEKREIPTSIFNHTLPHKLLKFHGGDVARMEVLLKYGGIYLDYDSYIVRSMNDFRRFEFSIGWKLNKYMGNQVIVCHKNSRFLKLWYESYKNYRPESFYYNAGVYPTDHILRKMPYLIHRVPELFGNYDVKRRAYQTEFENYKDYYALHLLTNRLFNLKNISKDATYPVNFNEDNVLKYPVGFRRMCLEVYPYPEHVLKKFNIKL